MSDATDPLASSEPTHSAPSPSTTAIRESARVNILAIAALIGAFWFSLSGIILGHIALSQINRTGDAGRGLALAGLILGYIFTALTVCTFILWAIFMASYAAHPDVYQPLFD